MLASLLLLSLTGSSVVASMHHAAPAAAEVSGQDDDAPNASPLTARQLGACLPSALQAERDEAHRQHARQRIDGSTPTMTLEDVDKAEAYCRELLLHEALEGRDDHFKGLGLPAALGLPLGLAGSADAATEAADELLSIVTEIALERAKQRGLAFVQQQITDAVCELELPATLTSDGKPHPALPATCALLRGTSIEQLAEDPQLLRAPLFSDLVEAIGRTAIAKTLDVAELRPMAELSASIVARSVAARRVVFTTQDARSLLSAWGRYLEANKEPASWKNHCGLLVGLEVTRALLERPAELRSASELVEAYYPKDVACLEGKVDGYATALEVATLADRALRLGVTDDGEVIERKDGDGQRANASPDDARPDVQQRLRAAIQLGFLVTRELVGTSSDAAKLQRLDLLERLLLAAVDQNAAEALAAATSLLLTGYTDASTEQALLAQRHAEKASALLSAVTSYASTYANDEERTPEELREARTEAVEGLIDATTVRSNRQGDAVWSIGIPVGFIAGGQWVSEGNGFGSGRTLMAPQLSVPFGVAFQVLPGRRVAKGKTEPRDIGVGLHVMGTALDLGQYASYDEDGDLNRPRWDSLLAPGLQLGMLIGSPQHSFVLAADVRYAPTLFATSNDLNLQDERGGALRVGATLSYYVPFFDFN